MRLLFRFGAFAVTAALSLALADAAEHPSGLAGHSDYLTYHYDNARTGWNPHETVLTAANVASRRFGLVRVLPTDSVVYAQPLYVAGVATDRGTHNLVFIANEKDSVYAYDADSGALVWRRTFIDQAAGITAQTRDTVADCNSIGPTIGISSTPVIDRATQTLYVVDKIQVTKGMTQTWHHNLHALDLRSGIDRTTPAEIEGSYRNADGSTTRFYDQRQQNRPGLALANGRVYVAFGSSCDATPGSVHGWMFAYDRTTLVKTAVFATTATSQNSTLGSIWQSTLAPAVDAAGNLFVTTGNGTFDAALGGRSYADSVLRLTRDLALADFFAPANNLVLSDVDQDVGSTGVMLVPDSAGHRLAIAGVKNGIMYVLNRDALGGFEKADRAVQEIVLEKATNSLYGGPAFYPGHVFWGAGMQPLEDFRISLSPTPKLLRASHTTNAFPGEGGEIPAVSSNGTQEGSAVVWATTRPSQGGTIELYAYDARDLGRTLFRGAVGTWYPKGDAFLTPTVVDGHVFVGGSGNGVAEFGMR